MIKDKPLYVSAANHKFLKSYASKSGGKLKTLTEKVIAAGIKSMKLKK